MDVHAFEELGLYDPRAPNAAERLALLEYLHEQGLDSQEMLDADRQGRLGSIAADPLLQLGGERLTAEQMSERTGIPFELGKRIWRAAGFPDPGDAAIFTEADVVASTSAAAAIEFFGEEAALQFVRLLGSMLARISEAMLTLFEANIGTQMRADDAAPVDVARASVDAAALAPLIVGSMDPLLRHHIMAARQRRWAAMVGPTTTLVRLGVGFADLVGFTKWSQERTGVELAAAIATFEARASEIAGDEGGRIVKTIGDEVMFVAGDESAVCRIASALVDAFADHPIVPPLRAGLAFGEVIPQDGDYFGEAVNLAARAVKLAEVGDVLVDSSIAREAAKQFAFEATGARALKGFDEPVELYRLVAAL